LRFVLTHSFTQQNQSHQGPPATSAQMAVPQVNHPAYIIYRDVPPGEAYDATSPLSFFPPKGSDELFDALRESFPYLKTHSERMRDAIIQFLLEERQGEQGEQGEQFELSPATTMESSQVTWPSVSSGSASVFSSPDLLNFPTPASFDSPRLQQTSTASSSQPSPPSLDQMTGVFSLSSNPQPKQRIRRKMTEAEKIEYRKRRIVKACDKCAKRKRKCPHNQAEMKTIATPSTKSTSPQSGSSAEPSMRQADQHFTPAFDETFDPTTFGSFGDFNMFDDPLPEISVDDFFHFEQFEQDANTLFNNATHDPSRPTQRIRQHNAPVHTTRDTGNDVLSRSIQSQHGVESQSMGGHVNLPPNIANALPGTQTYPSQQQVVRDSRTGDLLHEVIPSSHTLERQSRRAKDEHRLDSSGITSLDHSQHATSSNRNDTLLSDPLHPNDVPGQRSRPPRSSRPQEETALASTSVPTQSDASAPANFASLQGRPQSTRLSSTPVLREQAPDTQQGGMHQLSLGEGIRRDSNLATELFMLRRRLPKTQARRTASSASREDITNVPAQTKSVEATSRGQQSPEQLSAQANGGAYLQLGSENIAPTHTSRRTYRGGRVVEVRDAPPAQQDVSATKSVQSVHEDRLSDHVRYRDHHGRAQQAQGLGLPQFAFAMGAIMLLAIFTPSILVPSLVLLLASQSAGDPDGIVQCTTKNSSWLSAFQKEAISADIGFRTLKTRQYIRGSSSPVGASLFESGPGAWLMGLMYPFRLAPLLFTAA